MSRRIMTTMVFLLLELFPLIPFEFDFVSILNHKYLSEYFDGTW